MAYLRNPWQYDIVEYISESLIETIVLDRGYCKGNLYASFWFLILICLNITHLVHLYWTFTIVRQNVPTVKKFTQLPPKMNLK